MKAKAIYIILSVSIIAVCALTATAIPVSDDPLVRMPGTQPAQGVTLEAPTRCLNCHGGYSQAVEPGFNWKGSMMAQAARDPLFWACLTVAAQDSIWAIGTPNAVDLCERCHFPEGWLAGRSDPPNASAMTGSDFDGLHCDFCHQMWDPFFETTYGGTREGNDWIGYWDEAGNTGTTATLSQTEAQKTWLEDRILSSNIKLFNSSSFFNTGYLPKYEEYTESGSGQYFVSPVGQKRSSYADTEAKHKVLYSRYHKSKYMCGTCHDVSNPVLANLDVVDPSLGLTTEKFSAYKYFHVERTFSEFMLSAYGQQGGAATNPDFQAQGAPDITWAAKCQDCHMRDVKGAGCNKQGAPIRPDQSIEHPNSGLPAHDLTGGNLWVSYILASLDPNGPVYDPENVTLLDNPGLLTLDLNAGETPKTNGAALKAGSDRAKEQLRLAATIKDLNYNTTTGALSFKVQNNTGHKLISGFPEGRRMFVNVRAYNSGGTNLLYEVNPYDDIAGTLKGLSYTYSAPPQLPALLNAAEAYVDELVYEVHPSSFLTEEDKTFHFVLATGRHKDNRIPPKGFSITNATDRISTPVWEGAEAPNYYTAGEYAGGYDAVSMTIAAMANADYVEVNLYYQTTSREYIEFLWNEIKGTYITLPPEAYIVQTDPWFAQLKDWGNTIRLLWMHNMNVDGAKPLLMTQATWGAAPAPCDVSAPLFTGAVTSSNEVSLTWNTVSGATGYKVYYDQAGKSSFIADVGNTTSFTDKNLTNGNEYCYKVTSYNATCESGFSDILCATPNPGGHMNAGVEELSTWLYVVTGKGKNKTVTLTAASTFTAGDTIAFHAMVKDSVTGLPVQGATVDISIVGPEVTGVTTAPSIANGMAEAIWNTHAPNKSGRGGTTPGDYTARVSNVSVSGYIWDGIRTSATFAIQQP